MAVEEANNNDGRKNVVIEFIRNVRWTVETMDELSKITAECEMTPAEGKRTATCSVVAQEVQAAKRKALFNLSRNHLGLPKLFRFPGIIEETARSSVEKTIALSQWENLCQEMGLNKSCAEYTA